MAKVQFNVYIPVPERKTRRNTAWRTSLFIAGFEKEVWGDPELDEIDSTD